MLYRIYQDQTGAIWRINCDDPRSRFAGREEYATLEHAYDAAKREARELGQGHLTVQRPGHERATLTLT
jgi:hypothetical protein